jgi:hypothetical protein
MMGERSEEPPLAKLQFQHPRALLTAFQGSIFLAPGNGNTDASPLENGL